jgi:hypothetical protein
MLPVKPEETLHDYLRRHFEKISKGKAQEFADQKKVRGFHIDINKWSPDGPKN